MPSSELPIAAQYVATFLKPEMLHLYRQIVALRKWRPVVISQKRENAADFPCADLVLMPKPRTHALRRFWQKQLCGRPITIYRSEARRLRALLERIDAGVLHIYFGHIGVHLLPLVEIVDRPVIVSFHGADAQVGLEKRSHLRATQRMFERATLILARSESLCQRLLLIGCPPEKLRLHRTGIPAGEIWSHARAAPADGAWQCVQACRLIPKKGLVTALSAFASFAEEYPRSSFTIAGEGPQLSELERKAAALGIRDRVNFTGFLSQDKLRALYAASHLFLHPSELGSDGDQEGIPNSMLEAMASGLPVAATRHGGIPEAVEHEISGRLVTERDPAALAAAMREIASSAENYTRMSRAAAARVVAEFDLGMQTRKLEALYQEATDLSRA